MSAYYASRRTMTTGMNTVSWSRNHNAVRHNANIQIGSLMHVFILFLIAVLIGLFALTQGTKVAQYDADIAGVNSEIAELEARRDALTVENAKITAAAATSDSNEVASTMVNTNSYPEYARE